jgi:ankyrin repeat protein
MKDSKSNFFSCSVLKLLNLLISKGASVNAKNVDGDSPLDSAVVRGNKEMARFLLKNGANVNSTNL